MNKSKSIVLLSTITLSILGTPLTIYGATTDNAKITFEAEGGGYGIYLADPSKNKAIVDYNEVSEGVFNVKIPNLRILDKDWNMFNRGKKINVVSTPLVNSKGKELPGHLSMNWGGETDSKYPIYGRKLVSPKDISEEFTIFQTGPEFGAEGEVPSEHLPTTITVDKNKIKIGESYTGTIKFSIVPTINVGGKGGVK